jgi:hypothetical protein
MAAQQALDPRALLPSSVLHALLAHVPKWNEPMMGWRRW